MRTRRTQPCPRKRGYPSSFTFALLFYDAVTAALAVYLAVHMGVVHSDLYWLDSTVVTQADIPFYNYPAQTLVLSAAARYSFDWVLYFTDALRVVPMVLYAVAVKQAVFFRTTTTVFFYAPVVGLFALLELVKLVYFAYWALFRCIDYPFCVQHNAALPHDSVQSTFTLAIVSAGVFLVGDLFYLGLPRLVRRAALPFVRTGAAMPAAAAPPAKRPSLVDFGGGAGARTTLLPRPRTHR